MKYHAWRIIKPQFKGTAFNGEGARLYGGRWNSKGIAMVYTAGTLSLAALELLVNLHSWQILNNYICIPIEFDSKLILRLEKKNLPDDWNIDPAPISTKKVGNHWAEKMKSVILEVPSAIIKEESNFLLNPLHPEFNKIKIGKAKKFDFDHRLIKKSIQKK